MVPSSFFIHVIEAERQRDLERWQRARMAALGARTAPHPGDRWSASSGAYGQPWGRGACRSTGHGAVRPTQRRRMAPWHAADDQRGISR